MEQMWKASATSHTTILDKICQRLSSSFVTVGTRMEDKDKIYHPRICDCTALKSPNRLAAKDPKGNYSHYSHYMHMYINITLANNLACPS